MMRFDLAFYTFVCVFLGFLVLLILCLGRGAKAMRPTLRPPRPKREPKPFADLTRRPDCELCDQQGWFYPQAPYAPPPRIILTRGRLRQVDTTGHFCPHSACAYQGRIGFGNIRANGHPNGRRWRQLVCLGCRGYFLETVGSPFYAKQVDPDKLVWAMAA